MYPSREVRAPTIEAQSGRPAAELVAGRRRGPRTVHAPPSRTHATEGMGRRSGAPLANAEPAATIPLLRRTEVEVHHVDLDLDYTLAHWPEDFVEWHAGRRRPTRYSSATTTPGCVLVGNDDEGRWTIGGGGHEVTGPPPSLLGWLLGRTDGIGLHTDEPLPDLGAWR